MVSIKCRITAFMARCTRYVQHYVMKFVSDLRQVGGFLRVLRFPPPIKLTDMILLKRLFESDVKHHKPKPTSYLLCPARQVHRDIYIILEPYIQHTRD